MANMRWTFPTKVAAQAFRNRMRAQATDPIFSAPVNLRYRVVGRTVVEEHYNRKAFR